MDDFGTGYSSLSKLQNFPIDTIKIDRSFINQMGTGGENIKLMRTILQLARDMHMVAIAEGVETADQIEQLKALNCVFAQGYYFARPLPTEAVEELLASAPRW
jgi:EAL domain-containing protein (putative c-di-GMP-specific phosphodiesterase class I)